MSNLTARPDGGSRGGCPRRADTRTWVTEQFTASAAALLARAPSDTVRRSVRVATPLRPALVLGSTQAESDVDRAACAERGVDIVRRRSGGGAVLVEPRRGLWAELVIPAGDELWCDDVGRAFLWVGRAWAAALAAAGVRGASVHEGAPVDSGWARRLCFAGIGPGEVTIDGRKVVGMAQRRTRSFALFQCAVPIASDPAAAADLLALGPAGRAAARLAVAERAAALSAVTPRALEAAFLASLETERGEREHGLRHRPPQTPHDSGQAVGQPRGQARKERPA